MKHPEAVRGKQHEKHPETVRAKTQETHSETVRDKQHASHPEAARTGHDTNVTSYDRDVWKGWPVVAMDPSTHPTQSPISTNQRYEMLLFLAQIFVSHTGITNSLAHSDSVWFCRFWFNRPNTAKWL